jgi:hypothetical protein
MSGCLSLFIQDYIFSLLTGYIDPPAGVEIREGMNYNPFFPGGAISMARVLFDGLVEYDDGESFTCMRLLPLTHPNRNTRNDFSDGERRGDIFELGS